MKVVLILLLLSISCMPKSLLQPTQLESFMFTEEITGEVVPLQPTKLIERFGERFPVEVYEIAMINAEQQFLPKGFPKTPIYAYAGKNE